MVSPRFPFYILSKGRADTAMTMPALDEMGVPYRVVVEESEWDAYAARYGEERLLLLPHSYQLDYEMCDDRGNVPPYGCGAARNFILDHARSEGAAWHWMADDNIRVFYRNLDNIQIPCGDGTPFRAMEDFVLRYRNVALAGPNYAMFVPARHKRAPYVVGTRIYSCQLVRCDVPFRWRGRMNEDTITCLDLLKAGWNTVLFNAFLQDKVRTGTLGGGMAQLYADGTPGGTLEKSQMLKRVHPDVTRIVWRFQRWHHYVDYDRWRHRPLIRNDKPVDDAPDRPYEFRRILRDSRHGRARSAAELAEAREQRYRRLNEG